MFGDLAFDKETGNLLMLNKKITTNFSRNKISRRIRIDVLLWANITVQITWFRLQKWCFLQQLQLLKISN